MATTSFKIQDNAVNVHANNLQTTIGQMNEGLSKFISSIANLPEVWQGTSFGSFDELTKSWQSSSKDLNSVLDTIQGRVKNSGSIYESMHAEQASALNAVNAGANWSGTKANI